MDSPLRSVLALLLGAGILILGNGLVGIVLPVRMGVEGLAPEVAGLVMSAYYAGLVLGALYGQPLIRRVGHIRAFAAFAALVCATTLTFPLWFSPILWALLRAVGGFCMAGLFATIESWLNHAAGNEARGRVLSIYMGIAYLASGVGQLLVNAWEVRGLELFSLSAMLLSLSLVPVVMTHVSQPDLTHTSPLSFHRLYAISPLGVAGSFGAGLMSGAFYGMGAIFGGEIGLPLLYVSLLMGITIFGGLIFQWPIGRLSDRFDRRTVLLWVLIATTFVCVVEYVASLLPIGGAASAAILLLLTPVFGGFVSTVYPISVAHTFDYVERDRMVGASSGMLLAWAIGATLGPLLASLAMGLLGPWALFLYLATIAAVLAVFTRYRMSRRVALPSEAQSTFVPRAETTVVHGRLDPRVEKPQGAAAE